MQIVMEAIWATVSASTTEGTRDDRTKDVFGTNDCSYVFGTND